MSDDHLRLDGLRGDNPLAFLAAVGSLVVLDRATRVGEEHPRLSWHRSPGAWTAVLHTSRVMNAEELVQALLPPRARFLAPFHEKVRAAQAAIDAAAKAPATKNSKATLASLRKARKEALAALEDAAKSDSGRDAITSIAPNLKKVEPSVFRAEAELAASAATPQNRRQADMLAAFGCEAVIDYDGLDPSRMSKQNGNSGKNMLRDQRSLVEGLTAARLAATLFGAWDYADEGLSMGWDPRDVRPYAHQSSDPGEGSVTMHGANFLAFEALALLPTAPGRVGRLVTRGTERAGRTERLSWPIWGTPIELPVVASLLAHPAIHAVPADRARLKAMGVYEVYRSEHVTVHKSQRLLPASPG